MHVELTGVKNRREISNVNCLENSGSQLWYLLFLKGQINRPMKNFRPHRRVGARILKSVNLPADFRGSENPQLSEDKILRSS